jgi:outer membrane protein OmpA-like peptidoglycan-associated protein
MMKRRAVIGGLIAAGIPNPSSALSPAFMVFFDADSVELSAPAWRTITQASFDYRATPRKIVITGHAAVAEHDTMALSLRRAGAVMQGMMKMGCPPDAIRMVGRGDTWPLIPGDKGAREMQNRRVEIVPLVS